MAQADEELANVEDAGQVECDGSGSLYEHPPSHGSGASTEHTTSHGSGSPSMPHLDLTQEEMDRQHPTLIPPDDERLDDLADDAADVVYQKGLVLAEEIRSETSLQGRKRRPIIATVQKQQQHDKSSMQSRTSTSRPFGGGVLSAATTYATTATGHSTTTTTATTATAGGRTTATTTASGEDNVMAHVGDTETEADDQGRRDVEQMQVLTCTSFGSNLPSPERPVCWAFDS